MVMGALKLESQLAVIGSGPGGYVAAIRAADLGQEVVLIEERDQPGGVCLLEGCIPSKTLIHAVEVAHSAREAAQFGLHFSEPTIDLDALRAFGQKTISGLANGVQTLLKRRGVEFIHGRGRFSGPTSLAIEGGEVARVDFANAIIATGSRPRRLDLPGDEEVWTSTEALAIPEIPKRLLIIGGGYIGMELGLVYAGLGSRVTLLETNTRLLAGADPDLVEIMVRNLEPRFERIIRNATATSIERKGQLSLVTCQVQGQTQVIETDRVLASVGRIPNTDKLDLDRIGLQPLADGRLAVDETGRTAVDHIWAIGDVTPGPMLAHKASREGKVVAEVIAGHSSAFDNRAIPAVIYTDPEIAWAGLTQQEAEAKQVPHRIGTFPLRALGRARTLGKTSGLVKILSDPDSGLVLGVGMVGPSASELIAEGTLAIEMGATLEDLMVTIHPHPTLSEAIVEAAEVAAGHPIHVLPRTPAA